MEKYFLDIYSLPEINYQEKIGIGFPLELEEFNCIVEELYRLFTSYDSDKEMLKVIRIAKATLIGNISNFIRLSIVNRRLKDKFEIRYTTKEEFNTLAGERNMGQGYIADFFAKNSMPMIQPFLKGYWYDKKKEYIKKLLSTFPEKNNVVIFNGNKWVEDYLKEQGINYTKLYNTFFWKMSEDPNIVKKTKETQKVNNIIEDLHTLLSKKFEIVNKIEEEKLFKILQKILKQTYTDYINCKNYIETKNVFFNEIYSGTCGSYFTRIVFEVLKEKGVKTNAFMHSGAISHINYTFDPRLYIEYEIPDNFFLFNSNDIPIIQKRLDTYNLSTKLNSMNIKVKKIDSEFRSFDAKNIKNIIYMATTTPGGFQFFGVDDDMRKVCYENRLFEFLEKSGYKVLYKTHPKGVRQNYNLLKAKFKNLKIVENKTVDEVINDDNDIFIFKMVDSTAFNEVMSTDKPAIVISENQEELLSSEAKESLKNRVSFVDCHYENGLAVINENQLKEALNRKYTMDFEFANRFQ